MYTPDQLLEMVNKALEREDLSREPAGLYDPIAYILSLGGKRIRPVMLLMACDMFGGAVHKGIPAALGIEIFHNFSLVHDDIMDRAPLRRGKPTVHERWNANTAILSGDTMLVKAYEQFMNLPEHLLKPALTVFNQTAVEVCEGQQYDMEFETREEVSIPDYLEMIRLKTAVLIGAAFQLGGLVAEAGTDDQKRLYEFGIHTGMVFQLRDDLLDTYGDADLFGKKPYGDIVANKKTFLYLKALELLPQRDRKKLLELYSHPAAGADDKVRKVLGCFDQVNVRKYTEEEIVAHYHQARHAFEDLNVPGEKKKMMAQYTESLMGRAF